MLKFILKKRELILLLKAVETRHLILKFQKRAFSNPKIIWIHAASFRMAKKAIENKWKVLLYHDLEKSILQF